MENNMKSKLPDTVIKVLGVLSLIFIATVMAITTYAVSFSVMTADDFWFAQDTGRFVNWGQYITACYDRMIHEYLHWQGTYFAEFISALFNPVNVGGLESMAPLMIINLFLSLGSTMVLLYVLLAPIQKDQHFVKHIIAACVVFVIMEFNVFPEIFFWYTGATVNSLPLALGCLALSAFIISNRTNKRIWVAISCALAFLAVGGTLAVSGTLCYVILVISLYYFVRDKKIRSSNVIIFAFFFAGSLINAIAPGNFARQTVASSADFGVIDAVVATWQTFRGEVSYLFNAYNFAAVLCVFVACGALLSGKSNIDKKAWIISSIAAILTPLITIFPVVLGYKVPWIPNRCMYILYTVIAFTFGDMCLVIGSELVSFVKGHRYFVAALMAVFALIVVLTSEFEPRSYRTARILKGLYDHTYQDSYNDTKELFDYFSKHEGEDIIVETAVMPEDVEYYSAFHLRGDATDRVNRAVAWKFGLKSVSNSAEQ